MTLQYGVYFDQQMGGSHAVHCLKSSFLLLKQIFPSFSITNQKKDKKSSLHFIFFPLIFVRFRTVEYVKIS